VLQTTTGEMVFEDLHLISKGSVMGLFRALYKQESHGNSYNKKVGK
jgi:hypothetical protein